MCYVQMLGYEDHTHVMCNVEVIPMSLSVRKRLGSHRWAINMGNSLSILSIEHLSLEIPLGLGINGLCDFSVLASRKRCKPYGDC